MRRSLLSGNVVFHLCFFLRTGLDWLAQPSEACCASHSRPPAEIPELSITKEQIYAIIQSMLALCLDYLQIPALHAAAPNIMDCSVFFI